MAAAQLFSILPHLCSPAPTIFLSLFTSLRLWQTKPEVNWAQPLLLVNHIPFLCAVKIHVPIKAPSNYQKLQLYIVFDSTKPHNACLELCVAKNIFENLSLFHSVTATSVPLTSNYELRQLFDSRLLFFLKTGVFCCQASTLPLPPVENNCALIKLDGTVVVPARAQTEAFSTISTVQGQQLCRVGRVKATKEKQASRGDCAGVPPPAVEGAGPGLPAIRSSQDVTGVGKAGKDDSVDQVKGGAVRHVPLEDPQVALGFFWLWRPEFGQIGSA